MKSAVVLFALAASANAGGVRGGAEPAAAASPQAVNNVLAHSPSAVLDHHVATTPKEHVIFDHNLSSWI